MIVKELLRVVEDMKKDLEYTRRLENRWQSEQKRFPLIYKYIIKQREFFQEQIDKAMTSELDESKLDEYVKGRPGVKVQKLQTAQVTPPKEEPAPKPVAAAPNPEPVKTETEKPKPEKPKPVEAPPAAKEPAPPVQEPTPPAQEEGKIEEKAIEEATAAAMLKLKDEEPEAKTQPVKSSSRKKSSGRKKIEEPVEKKPEEDRASSRDKLRRLASEVLNEVKKSKTD